MNDTTRTDPDRDDERFMAGLAAADPVDPATLAQSDTVRADELLDRILATEPDWSSADAFVPPAGNRPTGPTVATPAGASAPAGAAGPVGGPQRQGLGARGRVALVAAAAAVAVVAGGVAVLAPDSTPAALAEVRAAAAATADADSGVIVTDFDLHYLDATEDETVSGHFEARYDGADLALSIELADLPALAEVDRVEEMLPDLADIRLVDDVIYLQRGGRWMAVETDGLLGSLVVEYVDPRIVLDAVQTLSEVSEEGTAVVDGVSVTRYHSVLDLGDGTLAQSGWLAFDGMDIEADGEVAIDLLVDGDGNLRRIDLAGDIRPAEGVDGPEEARSTFEVSTTFSGLDADVVIEAPEGAVPFDPMGEVFDG